MRNWLAHWLRRLATRLDGDLYFPVSPELKAAARDLVQDKFQRHVDEAVLHGKPKCNCALPGINVPFRSGATPKTHLEWCESLKGPQGFRGQRVQAIVLDDAAQLWEDRLLFGNSYTINGKRVPPEDVVLNTRTGRYSITPPKAQQEPSGWYQRLFLGFDEAPTLDDGQVDRLTAAIIKEPACNCKTAQDFSDPHDMGVKHLPMCPQYRKPRPDPDFEDPGITENGKPAG